MYALQQSEIVLASYHLTDLTRFYSLSFYSPLRERDFESSLTHSGILGSQKVTHLDHAGFIPASAAGLRS